MTNDMVECIRCGHEFVSQQPARLTDCKECGSHLVYSND